MADERQRLAVMAGDAERDEPMGRERGGELFELHGCIKHPSIAQKALDCDSEQGDAPCDSGLLFGPSPGFDARVPHPCTMLVVVISFLS